MANNNLPVLTKEEYVQRWENRIKCRNHPLVIATRSSIEKDYPLCWRCDPDHKKKSTRVLGARRSVLPSSMIEVYEQASKDEHLVELGEDIAVTEARIQSILKSIKQNPLDSSAFFTSFRRNFNNQLKLVKRGMLSYAEFITSMQALLDGKVSEMQMYEEFYKVTDIKRRLVDAETTRVAKLGWSPGYVRDVVLAMTQIVSDMFPPTQLKEFTGRLREHPVFQNKSFNLLPSERVIDTEIKNGTYESVVSDPQPVGDSVHETGDTSE